MIDVELLQEKVRLLEQLVQSKDNEIALLTQLLCNERLKNTTITYPNQYGLIHQSFNINHIAER